LALELGRGQVDALLILAGKMLQAQPISHEERLIPAYTISGLAAVSAVSVKSMKNEKAKLITMRMGGKTVSRKRAA
jgi:hypothetical protein